MHYKKSVAPVLIAVCLYAACGNSESVTYDGQNTGGSPNSATTTPKPNEEQHALVPCDKGYEVQNILSDRQPVEISKTAEGFLFVDSIPEPNTSGDSPAMPIWSMDKLGVAQVKRYDATKDHVTKYLRNYENDSYFLEAESSYSTEYWRVKKLPNTTGAVTQITDKVIPATHGNYSRIIGINSTSIFVLGTINEFSSPTKETVYKVDRSTGSTSVYYSYDSETILINWRMLGGSLYYSIKGAISNLPPLPADLKQLPKEIADCDGVLEVDNEIYCAGDFMKTISKLNIDGSKIATVWPTDGKKSDHFIELKGIEAGYLYFSVSDKGAGNMRSLYRILLSNPTTEEPLACHRETINKVVVNDDSIIWLENYKAYRIPGDAHASERKMVP